MTASIGEPVGRRNAPLGVAAGFAPFDIDLMNTELPEVAILLQLGFLLFERVALIGLAFG